MKGEGEGEGEGEEEGEGEGGAEGFSRAGGLASDAEPTDQLAGLLTNLLAYLPISWSVIQL